MWYTWTFGPVFSRDRAQTQQERYERKKKIRCWLRVGALLILLVGSYFLRRWLVHNGVEVSDQTIVFLTLVLLFVTYLQWDVAALQNLAIERQLDQIEFQQRAWLATTATPIRELVTGLQEGVDSVDISEWGIEVRNAGHTPGIITHSRIEPLTRPISLNHRDEIILVERRARGDPERRTVVAPGSSIVFRLNDGGANIAWSDKIIELIRNPGSGQAGYLLGAFVYQDVFDREHKTTCCYKFNAATQQLDSNHQDGEMT